MKYISHLKSFKFAGGRVIKTGLSVFITAWICLLLDLPAIFAVITAIVTTEPTASDSIRKGIIRLPAAAIGAAISLSFTSLFGETALTYALAASLTILVLHKLQLDAGILVATLTAVAMIPETTDHFLIAFIVRLGTTATGIAVSTLVNFIILPPKFYPIIHSNLSRLFRQTADVLDISLKRLLSPEKFDEPIEPITYNKLRQQLDRTFQLCDFQRDEWKYHKHKSKDIRSFRYAQKKLNSLQQIVFHLGNLQYVHLPKQGFTEKEKRLLLKASSSIVAILRDDKHTIPNKHYRYIEQLDEQFWHIREKMIRHTQDKYHHHFAPQAIILYEILSMHDVLEDLEQIQLRQDKTLEKS